jgi:flagellar biosynthesis/type III secretory pathway chaperone
MSTPTANIISSLQELLQQQLLQVETYIEYLSSIKSSISTDDSEVLQKLIENPPLEAEQIELNQRHQQQLLVHAGFTAEGRALDDFIGNNTATEQLAALNDSLKQAVKKLEQSLFINTLLLQKSQHRVKQSIRLLSGHAMASTPSSYSRAGETDSGSDSKHIIAQA